MPSLDELLGRQRLKDRIAELEDTCERLEAQLEAAENRRREAVRARQTAEERVNTLEDRVAGLEGELEQRASDADGPTWSRVDRLRMDAVEELLATLGSVQTPPEGALSASVHDSVPATIRDALGDGAGLIVDLSPCVCYVSEAGLVRAVLVPPRPPDPFVRWDRTFEADASWFLPEQPLTFALVRSDLFAVGHVEGRALEFVDGFESDVMGRHSKGGFSQARFERRRQEQIDAHLERARATLGDFEDDRIIVGDRDATGRLGDLAVDTGVVDASGDPASALERAFRDYWTTHLYLP